MTPPSTSVLTLKEPVRVRENRRRKRHRRQARDERRGLHADQVPIQRSRAMTAPSACPPRHQGVGVAEVGEERLERGMADEAPPIGIAR